MNDPAPKQVPPREELRALLRAELQSLLAVQLVHGAGTEAKHDRLPQKKRNELKRLVDRRVGLTDEAQPDRGLQAFDGEDDESAGG